jgi:ribosomal protein L11 methyltransferase
MSAQFPPLATAVARLATDAATARRISDAVTETFDCEEVAASAFEQANGRWSLTLDFRDSPDEAAVRALVAATAGATAAQALVFETLAPTDWVRKSQEGLTPVGAGRFVVHAAHHRGRVQVNRIGIQIEVALAFGTGHHGTTRGCLLALDRIAKAQNRRRRARHAGSPIRRRKRAMVLDVGTGTGVLAIAAAKALRRPVLASDIDARAVAIARDNARINGVADHIATLQAAGVGMRRFRQHGTFRLIFANILLEPLRGLATPMARLVAPGGYVVLSGLLAAQAPTALASYHARGLVLAHRIPIEGWMTLVLVRPLRSPATRLPCGGSIAGLSSAP